jgi:uncharacterized protein involved in response to NO
MSLSDYLEAEILDHIFSKGAYTPPTWYVGLSTADPGEDGATLSEPTAMAYARVALGAVTRTAGSVVNNAAVEFVEATGDWGTITHFALFDAASGGNFMGSGELTSPLDVTTGKTARFPAGEIAITLT